MTNVRFIAIGLFVALGAGCGGSAHLAMQTRQADPSSLTISVLNTGDSSTAPLILTLTTAGVFFVDSDDCSGQSLAPEQSCIVRIGFLRTAVAQPEGTLAVDGGHGTHATMSLDVVLSVVQLVVNPGFGSKVNVNITEGSTADAMFTVTNFGSVPSGPITLDFAGMVVNDHCTGVALSSSASCSFSVEYTAPLGHYAPVKVSGTVSSDPGGGTPATAYFTIVPLLYAGGPLFGSGEPAGATSYMQIVNPGAATTPIGPLQLSFVKASGSPLIDYPPFLLVAGQDMCSGKTLSGTQNNYCSVVVGLDPRLPAGGSYRATLLVQAGIEMLSVPVQAGRGTP